MTVSSDTKTPKSGEYWFARSGRPLLCIDTNDNGHTVWRTHFGEFCVFHDEAWSNWHHEPRCTGFDWVEPPAVDPGEGYELLPVGTVLQDGDQFKLIGGWRDTKSPGGTLCAGDCYRRKIKPPAEVWPKWYILDETKGECKTPWYIKRTSDKEALRWGLNCDGITTGYESQSWGGQADTWIEVTKAEALARVTPADPYPHYYESTEGKYAYLRRDSEESGQLVLLDGTDFGESTWYPHDGAGRKRLTKAEALARVTPTEPEFCTACGVHSVVPGKLTCSGCAEYVTTGNAPAGTFKITPDAVTWGGSVPRPVPAAKRVPVRLWCLAGDKPDEWGSNIVVSPTQPRSWDDQEFQEIHSDGNGGWCVEIKEGGDAA